MLNNWYQTFVILNTIAMPSCAKLYKQTKFPIKDTTSTTYREEINAMSKVQCASNCGIDTVNCKAFNFYPSTSTCQYISFVYALPSVASSSQKLSGYVENGLFTLLLPNILSPFSYCDIIFSVLLESLEFNHLLFQSIKIRSRNNICPPARMRLAKWFQL